MEGIVPVVPDMLVVPVMVTANGMKDMGEVLKYFDNDKLTVRRRYTKNLLANAPRAPECIVTILEVVSSNGNETWDFVRAALIELNAVLPGAAMFYRE